MPKRSKASRRLGQDRADSNFIRCAEKLSTNGAQLNAQVLAAACQLCSEVLGPDTRFEPQGSRAKHTNLKDSDFDFHIVPPPGRDVTEEDRDAIVKKLKGDARIHGKVLSGRTAIKIEEPCGRIELVPIRASYHDDDVVIEKPDPYFINSPGAQRAVIVLKDKYGEDVAGHEIEKKVKMVAKRFNLDDMSDPSGRHRYEKAQVDLHATFPHCRSWTLRSGVEDRLGAYTRRDWVFGWDSNEMNQIEKDDEDPGLVARWKACLYG